MAFLRFLVPRLHHGTVYYLPSAPEGAEGEEGRVELPPLDEAPPPSWRRLEGPFHNVYATKQAGPSPCSLPPVPALDRLLHPSLPRGPAR
jgi:hypothetical protein